MVEIKMDLGAEEIISVLEKNGYEAYAVGGCVRDCLMGKTPDDWDITTSALPQKVCEIFSYLEVIPTGIKHGTVTVRLNGKNYEITTFRTEGEYLDSRRPEKVDFVSSIEEDLKRRDFTVNAMAYSKKRGLIDLYGGLDDLNGKIIRTVGEPKERFLEDSLRILRGARFCSKLGFKIEEKTLFEMENLSQNLKKVSSERVFAELNKLLVGEYVKDALLICRKVIFAVIPELERCYGFNQRSKWHKYDVYTHTVTAVSSIENDFLLRFTMLMHDVGKPDKFFVRNGEGHFYGHPKRSAEITEKVLKRLKAPIDFSRETLFLVEFHDKVIPIDRKRVKKELSLIGKERFFNLIKVKLADGKGQATDLASEEIEKTVKVKELAEDIIKSGECYKIEDLKIDGNDVKNAGFCGKEIGAVLNSVLKDVIDGNLENDRESILKSVLKRREKLSKSRRID